MVFTSKRKSQQKKQLSQLNETLKDFLIGSKTNLSVIEVETLESQTDGFFNNPARNVAGW